MIPALKKCSELTQPTSDGKPREGAETRGAAAKSRRLRSRDILNHRHRRAGDLDLLGEGKDADPERLALSLASNARGDQRQRAESSPLKVRGNGLFAKGLINGLQELTSQRSGTGKFPEAGWLQESISGLL